MHAIAKLSDLGPLLDIDSDGSIVISATGGLTVTFGAYLGPADPSEAITASTLPIGVGCDRIGGSTSLPSRWPIS